MSEELLLNPKYWRDRAEEARTMAAALTDKQAQETLFGIARGYDRLAQLSAELVKRPKKPKQG